MRGGQHRLTRAFRSASDAAPSPRPNLARSATCGAPRTAQRRSQSDATSASLRSRSDPKRWPRAAAIDSGEGAGASAAAYGAAAAAVGGAPQAGGVAPPPPGCLSQWECEIEDTLKLVALLPPSVRSALEVHPSLPELLEVVMDLGRPPLARFPGGDVALAAAPLTAQELQAAVERVGTFGGDNRAGIDRTLHRISALRNRAGRVVGLTCRVGRAVPGSAALAEDLIRAGASILFLGRPGVGKTTVIRELSRLLADDCARRVVIVDTSNEIGGDGDVPHDGIGRARRMQVPNPEGQHRVMIEAVENHMPQVVVIDEIGTEAECAAARTIAQRGVQLIATAHGNELENVVKNPSLADLVGGVQSVTLGDDEAKRRGVQKSVLERAAPPTFEVAVEMLERGKWRVHTDVAAAVDALLAGGSAGGQVRERAADGSVLKYNAAPGGVGGAPRAGARAARAPAQQPRAGLPLPGGGAAAADARSGDSSALEGALPRRPPPRLPPAGAVADAAAAAAGGISSSFARPSPWAGVAAADGGGGARGRALQRAGGLQLGLSSPEGALLRLHAFELEEDRLWEVMTAMALHDKVFLCPSPEGADAVLAVRPRLKSATALRAAARAAGVPIYAVKSSSGSNLVKAFRTLLGVDPSAGGGVFGAAAAAAAAATADAGGSGGAAASASFDLIDPGSSADEAPDSDGAAAAAAAPAPAERPPQRFSDEADGLEEARLAAEAIVVPLGQPVEVLPRAEAVRAAQAQLLASYGLGCEVVGEGASARVRILPAPAAAEGEGEGGVAAAATGLQRASAGA